MDGYPQISKELSQGEVERTHTECVEVVKFVDVSDKKFYNSTNTVRITGW